MWQALGADITSKFSYTQKTGIMYENWGTKNKLIMHSFPFGSYSIHFNPDEFQRFILDSLKVNGLPNTILKRLRQMNDIVIIGELRFEKVIFKYFDKNEILPYLNIIKNKSKKTVGSLRDK